MLEKLTAALRQAVSDTRGAGKVGEHGYRRREPEQASPEPLRAHLKYEIDTLGGLLVKAGVKAN